MLRFAKKFAWLAVLAVGLQYSWGFALLGPNNETWQVPEIGYNPLDNDPLPTGPKNIGEEYRRNTPVMYYSYDAAFLDYFGESGVQAVDSACGVYSALTNVSQYSRELNEFPTSVTRENYQAEALSLYDLKSYTMHLLAEQLGLAEPERYVWNIHDRYQLPNTTCPDGMEYLIVQRNFDPVPSALNQFQNSSYVNGVLYSYFVLEICTGDPPLAEALEFPVDPLDFAFTAVAGRFDRAGQAIQTGTLFAGKYYIGLTRDDVGGLRYLLQTNNMNWESPGSNTVVLATNLTPQLLYTSNLNDLATIALTNDAAALAGIFPGLLSVSSNYFLNVYTTNVDAYFTNYPFDPAGTPPHLAFTTNRTVSVGTFFSHTFLNLLTIVRTNNTWVAVPVTTLPRPSRLAVTIQTTTVGVSNAPWSPDGSTIIATNTTSTIVYSNLIAGDYVLLPTNWCDLVILSSQLTNTIATTNSLISATNTVVINNPGDTNAVGTLFSFSQNVVTYFRQRVFVVKPVICGPATPMVQQGVEKITFVRRDFDSLLGRFFYPITNSYVINAVTNNAVFARRVQRVVTEPDILFSAADLDAGPSGEPRVSSYDRNVNFNSSLANQPLAGPGTIESPTVVHFNKAGPTWLNGSPNAYFLNQAEASQVPTLIWGSFDATTNLPTVYPNGTSLEMLANQVLIQILPDSLPDAALGTAYSAQFSVAAGGQAPFAWSLAPGSPGLPPGFATLPSGMIPDGLLTGTPTAAGTYDFVIRMTDAQGRTVDRNYSLTITP